MAKFKCFVCGYIFDEEQAGIPFSEISECPICAESRDIFRRMDEEEEKPAKEEESAKEDGDAPKEADSEKKDSEVAKGDSEKVEKTEEPKEEAKENEGAKEEAKEEPKSENGGFVIEKRQEFWLNEKDKEPEKPVDTSNIQTYYSGGIPVKSPEELEREAKKIEEENRPRLDPIDGSGSVHTVIDGGDRSSDGSDSEVVVVENNEATSDVDAGDDDFVFEEAVIESDVPLQTEEVPAAVSAGICDGGDFFTGFDSNPDFGGSVMTEEFIFDDEEPVGEVVELTEEEAAEETAEEAVEEVAEETAEEAVEEETAEEAVEEVAEETAEEAVEEVAEETAEEAVEEVAEETVEEPVEEVVIEEEVIEEPVVEETVEETEEEPVEEVVIEEEVIEEPVVEETAEEIAEEPAEEVVIEEEVIEEPTEEESEEEDLILDASLEDTLIEELLLGRIFGDFEEDDTDDDFDALRAFLSGAEDEAESEFMEDEDLSQPEEHIIGTAVIKGGNSDLITEDMAKQHSYEQYAPASVQNGLEEIILLPAQLDPLPFASDEEIQTQTTIGKFALFPVTMPEPFGASSALSWGEYIPHESASTDYSGAELILVKGQYSHIPSVSGKEELRREVARAKEISGGKPVGISLMIGRIEQDLATCVFADVDFVVLNDASTGMLPYALRRAKKYLSRVNSGLELLIGIEDVNDTKEIAKMIALGADYILLNREYDSVRCDCMKKELKEIARNTGHGSVQEFNMYDICTISADLASNTDISHF